MSGTMPPDRDTARADQTPLEITVAVCGPLARYLRTDRGRELCAGEVGAQLGHVITDLGLTARSVVDVRILAGLPPETASPENWIQLRVAGTRCRYPAELLSHLAAAMEGRVAERVSPPLPEDWTRPDDVAPADTQQSPAVSVPSGKPSSPDRTSFSERRAALLIGMTCAEAVKLRPSVLLAPELVQKYARNLRGRVPDRPAGVTSPEWLAHVLGGVLDLGIGVGDQTLVAKILVEGEESRPCDARESLISALSAESVEVLVPEAIAALLGTGEVGDEGDLLAYVAGAMLDENGVLIPAFRVASPPKGLPAGCFAFRLNSLLTSPMALLAPDDILVNDTPERLALRGVSARPAVNPDTGTSAALVAAADQSRMEADGLTAWNQAGHVLLCLAHVLRTRAGWLIHQDKTQAQLDVLADLMPALVGAVRSSLRPAELTALLRALAADKVSLRNLPPVLERVVDSAYGHSSTSRIEVLGDPVSAVLTARGAVAEGDPAWLEAFVRTGLRHTIADHRTRHSGTLAVHLLDPELERLLRTDGDEQRDNQVIAVIGAESRKVSKTAQMPYILTADDVRPVLRSVVACVLPRLGIVGYGDLPPDLNIQPVSWIALGDAYGDGEAQAEVTGAGEPPGPGRTGWFGPPTWYGQCPCGGRYEERTVQVRLTGPHAMPRVLPDIPQGACPHCGSRVYKLAVLQRIEAERKTARSAPAENG